MNVLVVGNGAREHAIAWKLHQSPRVSELFVAPGNAGTAQLAQNVPIGAADIDALLAFARKGRLDLTVVGPEAPLAAGIADRFLEAGLPVLGPTQGAARIESSKSFAKELMVANDVPTGPVQTFDSYAEGVEYLKSAPLPVVVKADGLAAGKGVVVAHTRQEALDALRQQMQEKRFGPAGERVLIEEFLEGEELSVFAFVDGVCVSTLVAARDYKRVGDGDMGPNTGGMGSYSAPSVWTTSLECRVRGEIMEPVARALASRGTPYRGVLYAGLMLTETGPKVLEFNCRLGDPEAQVILPRLKSDLADVMIRTAQGKLEGALIEWAPLACVAVVLASGGYPGEYTTGYDVDGLQGLDDGVIVFHAGTRAVQEGGRETTRIVTDGGRVLTLTALGPTHDEARGKAYANAERVRFKDSFYRRDIAALA